MQKPPLQLNDHIFPKIVVVSNKSKEVIQAIEEGKEFGYSFKFDNNVMQNLEDKLLFQVELNIQTAEVDDKIKGYEVDLTIAGFFTVEEDFVEDKTESQIADMVSVLGPTLLFGSAREYLYQLTSRGPFPAIYLPTVSFIPDPNGKRKKQKIPTAKKAAPKKDQRKKISTKNK